jgi:hypothetical protein
VNRVAAIENQLRQGVLMRFSRQFSKGVERMQRGICHPEHLKAAADLKGQLDIARLTEKNAIWARREVVDAFDRSMMELPPFLIPFEVPEHLDEDAIACVLAMYDKNVAPADVLLMAYSPAAELVPDMAAQDNQILDLMVQRYMGNPSINQDALMKLDWVRKLGETTANEVILPKDSIEAIAIEATRQQIIELQSIIAGQQVPVSPRDNDQVHLDTLVQKLMPLMEAAPEGGLTPEFVAPLTSAMEHFASHIQAAQAKGMPSDAVAKYKQLYKMAHDHLSKGMASAPPPEIQPAAAPAPRSGAQITAAGQKQMGETYGAQNIGQNEMISSVATPPRPPTAA